MQPCDDAPPDALLARRAALGDRTAFGQIFERHARSMFRYALNMLDGDPHEAEDAVQSALVQAWQHLPGFRGDAALSTWLVRITANEVRRARRRRRPLVISDDLLEAQPGSPADDPERTARQHELSRALSLALAELPWRQRASWLLREMEGLSYAELADVLQTSETVVRGQLHRARRTLAARMEQWR